MPQTAKPIKFGECIKQESLRPISLRQVDSPVKMVLSTRQDGLSGRYLALAW